MKRATIYAQIKEELRKVNQDVRDVKEYYVSYKNNIGETKIIQDQYITDEYALMFTAQESKITFKTDKYSFTKEYNSTFVIEKL